MSPMENFTFITQLMKFVSLMESACLHFFLLAKTSHVLFLVVSIHLSLLLLLYDVKNYFLCKYTFSITLFLTFALALW